MNIQTDRALLPAGEASTRYLIATITAPKSGRTSDRPALNVALVLDRSGSMAGRKIDLAKRAVAQAIAVLDERDRVAVVCYDNEIDTILSSTAAGAEAKALANSRLSNIDARGNTDLAGGWQRGVDQVGVDAAWSSLKRVLLLSDGLANAGETDPDVLAQRAAAPFLFHRASRADSRHPHQRARRRARCGGARRPARHSWRAWRRRRRGGADDWSPRGGERR